MRIIAVFFTLLVGSLFGQDKQICISIDDFPVVSYGLKNDNHEQVIANGILRAVKKHNVPVIGYVNEGKLYSDGMLDSSRLAILDKWMESGLELGNHTYSHLNYHNVSFQDFTEDVLNGEKVIKQLANKYNQEVKYFRHPYLRSGLNTSSTDSLKQFLIENEYQEAFVTVDNDEYLFASKYAKAYKAKDDLLMDKIGSAYLKYMEQKQLYFEEISIELFGRNIKHTLLIHANFLNSRYLDELLSIYEKLGYSFITQGDAISDEAYKTPVTRFGDWGISWIQRWGLSQGKKGSFFTNDPETPDFVK